MKKKNISGEDSDLFRQTVGQVQRVKSDKVAPALAQARKKIVKPRAAEDGWQRNTNTEIDPVDHEQRIKFSAPGVQNKVIDKLRKGSFGIQAELDLHGLNTHAAQQRLLQFLHASVNSGHRCVQIIHGKGYGSAEDLPVLKNRLNQWLRQHRAVQAFCSAPQRHGGAGAVWVLLKTFSD